MILAIFDFDGTITKRDSLIDFIQFTVGKNQYYLGLFLLSPILTAYKLKLLPNHTAKEYLFKYFFKNWSEKKFQSIADDYALNKINLIVKQSAISKILWHQRQGHKVIIISASIENWILKWSKFNQIELIATQIEIKNKKITGNFHTKNCYGIEKVNRLKELYNLDQTKYIYAYGDSKGDIEMLDIANEKYYKYFF